MSTISEHAASTLAESVCEVLAGVLPPGREFIPLHEPRFEGAEWEYLKECLDSTFVSSVGAFVDLFEERLAEYTGVKRAVVVVNGTAALEIALVLAGVTRDDEVIIPALTFVATSNAVSRLGAVPHLADSEEKTLGLNPAALEDYLSDITVIEGGLCRNRITGRIIRAVMPMHTYGHPVDMDPLMEVCQRFGLALVEDAAEALGTEYKGKHVGGRGIASALSFNGNKIITTGGGGAILTNDEELGKRAKHITTTAKTPHPWEFHHDEAGYNYRMPNINAALGCAQIEKLPAYLEEKRALAKRYENAFSGIKGARFFTEPEFARSNYWLNVLLLDEKQADQREAVLTLTNKKGFMTRPAWKLMHRLPMYDNSPRMDLPGAESLERRLINIPSSVGL